MRRLGVVLAGVSLLACISIGCAPQESAFAWNRVPSPTRQNLTGVVATAQDAAWAVGEEGTLLEWDGSEWKSVPVDTSMNLTRVRAGGGTVWALGDDGDALMFDGAEWTLRRQELGTRIRDILPLGPTSAIAVTHGLGRGSIWHWDGATWTPDPESKDSEFGHIWGTSPSDLWVAEDTESKFSAYGPGTGAAVIHISEGTRTGHRPSEVKEGSFLWKGMAGGTEGQPWLLGSQFGLGFTYRLVGTQLEELQSPSNMEAIWAQDAENAFVVGEDGEIRQFKNGEWVESLPWDFKAVTLRAVSGTSLSNLWAVGDEGVILHFDPSFGSN